MFLPCNITIAFNWRRNMFIANNYQTAVNNLPNLTNHEYMALQIWQLKHVFHNQIASIKNTRHEFVAFTERFATEFGTDSDLLGKTALCLAGMTKASYEEIHAQEENLITTHQFQDSMYLLKRNKEVVDYLIRKHPLINPTTNNCVGILINTRRFVPGLFRKILQSKFLPLPKFRIQVQNPELSEQQQHIAFCLLLGFHSRKEIATLLSTVTNSSYNETQIKNSLQALYNKFECHTPGQLLDLMTNGQISVELPAKILPEGNYPFDFDKLAPA